MGERSLVGGRLLSPHPGSGTAASVVGRGLG